MLHSLSLTSLPECELPVFFEQGTHYTTFYAPGCVVSAAPDHAETLASQIRAGDRHGWAGMLRQHATRALQEAAYLRQSPYQPECLTLYLHNACNLRCAYCYTDPARQADTRLDSGAVAAAADLVAANCQAKGLPFTAVFHGGGEPSLYPEQVDHLLEIIGHAAARRGLDVFRYVATNGVLSPDRARWLADRFELVGLSCDGPPLIQNRQRPTAGGGDSAGLLERTAEVLRQQGRPFHVRATITPDTLDQQTAIAAYLCEVLAPTEIHFEPVYLGGKMGAGAWPVQEVARVFVEHFISAQAEAARRGIPLRATGSRPEAIHGPYCNVFKQVLNLNAAGQAVACFKQVAGDALPYDTAIGQYDPITERIAFDPDRIAGLRGVLGAFPAECEQCFNRYHCTLGCPDRCGLDAAVEAGGSRGSFRCHVARALALHTIRSAAEMLWQRHTRAGIDGTTLI